MTPPLKEVEVVGLGQACVDFLGRIPWYPNMDGKVEISEFHIQCGGPASTALVTLSRLGIRCSFLGAIGDDEFGKKILKGLKEESIDTSHLRIRSGHTSQFAFIAIDMESGNRTIFWYRGSAPHLLPEEVDLSCFSGAKILHVDGLMLDAAIEAARQARSMGMKVVMDAGTFREKTPELIPLVDVLIASEEFARPLIENSITPESAIEILKKMGAKDVIITLGSRGSVGMEEGEFIYQKAYKVKAIDTTGAGDVYHGAYIYGILKGWGMRQCMNFASAVAAIKCKKIGARAGIPTLSEIENLFPDCGV